eukprot:356041-Amphidinium_carterae.2
MHSTRRKTLPIAHNWDKLSSNCNNASTVGGVAMGQVSTQRNSAEFSMQTNVHEVLTKLVTVKAT